MKKIKLFLSQKRAYVISLLATTVLLVAIFALAGYFPFGAKSIAHYDLYHQIVPYLNIAFDFFEGKISNFYLPNIAGGVNAFSFVIYFIFSPFYLVVLLFGRQNIALSMNLVFVLYVLAINFTAVFFVSKFLKGKLSPTFIALVSLLYTFSGFVLLNYTYTTWLNFPILMPLLVLAFLHMKTSGKIWTFSLLLFGISISCFGIGNFSLVLLFFLFMLYAWVVEEGEARKKLATKIFLGFLVAALLALVVVLPAFVFYKDASRQITGLTTMLENNLFEYLDDRILFFISTPVLFLVNVLFAVRADKTDKLNRFLIISQIVVLVSAVVEQVALAQNFGSYIGYPTRMGFVFSTLMLLVAIKAATEKNLRTMFSNSNAKKTVVKDNHFRGIFIATFAVAMFFLAALSFISYAASSTLFNATVNGLNLLFYLVIFLVITAFMVATWFFAKRGKLKKKSFGVVVLLLIAYMLVHNGAHFFVGNNADVDEAAAMATIVRELSSSDRVFFSSSSVSGGMPYYYGVDGFTGFNSLISQKTINSMRLFNNEISPNNANAENTTLFGAALLGYEYFIVPWQLNLPHFTLIKQENVNFLYRHDNALPRAYYLNTTQFEFGNNMTFYDKQNQMFNKLFGGQLFSVFEAQEIALNNAHMVNNNGYLEFQIQNKNDYGVISFDYVTGKNELLYFNVEMNKQSLNGEISVNGSNFVPVNETETITQMLNYFESGTSVNVVVRFKSNFKASEFGVAALDYDAFNAWVEKLAYDSKDITFLNDKNVFKVSASSHAEYEFVATPYVNLNGFSVANNASVAQLQENDFNFLVAKLQNGNNDIVFSYEFQESKVVLIITAFGFVLAALLLVANAFYNKTFKRGEGVLLWFATGVAVVIGVAMFVLPVGIFLYRVVLFRF